MLNRNQAQAIVIESLREVRAQAGQPPLDTITDETVLVGKDACLDSLGVVSLTIEIEQRVETEHGVSLTLANDKAMSQRNSPFRTMGVLVEHLLAMLDEARAA